MWLSAILSWIVVVFILSPLVKPFEAAVGSGWSAGQSAWPICVTMIAVCLQNRKIKMSEDFLAVFESRLPVGSSRNWMSGRLQVLARRHR